MKRSLVIIAIVLLLGAAGAGVFLFQAGSDTSGSDVAQNDSSDSTADDTSGSGSDGEADAETDGDGEAKEGADGDSEEGDEEDGETAVPVNVVDVELGSVSTYISATANLVPEDEVTVLAEVEGRLTELNVEEGDFVERGQVLARLQQDDEEIAYQKAEVRLANARMAWERAERMHNDDLIAKEEFDRLQMEHRVAEQELAEAKWALDRTEILSPFAGRITWRNITLGQHIRPGDELIRVTDFDPLISRIYLPERDVLRLDAGREVKITLKADEDVTFKGEIDRISPVVDTATGTVKVTVAAIAPPKVVRPGGFVIIDIVRETRNEAMVLPRKAVVRELKSAHVFVVKEDVAEKRSVEIGLEEDELLQIVSGVEPGETIVVAGQGGLKDGSKIKILEPDPETTTASNEDSESIESEG